MIITEVIVWPVCF